MQALCRAGAARHDLGDECDPRTQGRQDRVCDDGRVSRRPRDRLREPLRPIRHHDREAGPLVPRKLRLPVAERVDLTPGLEAARRGHGRSARPGTRGCGNRKRGHWLYARLCQPDHERRTRDLGGRLPDMSFSISAEVCPEIREYESDLRRRAPTPMSVR